MTEPRLHAKGLTVGYGDRTVIRDLDVVIPTNSFTVIVGPNACGKSTLLRALTRLITPTAGTVFLDQQDIHRYPTRQVAKLLALLPQTPSTPDGVTVIDLVSRGRYPHQRLFQQWSQADEVAVRRAMDITGTSDLADRTVNELSGGQRQRAWLAMVLAQDTELLLLDEPTTFLDVAHQIEVLELCQHLRSEEGKTLVAVLHDLNQACRYASHLIVMREGSILATGAPDDVLTPSLVAEAFRIECLVVPDPVTGTPMVVPLPGKTSG